MNAETLTGVQGAEPPGARKKFDSPLFVKTHDFLLWLMRHTLRFPKNLRHSYTLKLETSAFDFQEAILMANTARGPERMVWLEKADGKLLCLRALLRLAYDLQNGVRHFKLQSSPGEGLPSFIDLRPAKIEV